MAALQSPLLTNQSVEDPAPRHFFTEEAKLEDYIMSLAEKPIENEVEKDKVFNLNENNNTRILSFSSDSSLIITGSNNNLRVLNSDLTERFTLTCDEAVIVATCSKDKNFLACGVINTVEIWNININPNVILKTFKNLGELRDIKFSPDETFVAISSDSDNNSIKIKEIVGNNEFQFNHNHGIIRCLEFSSDGKFLVGGATDSRIIIWNFNERRLELTLEGHENAVNSIAFHPHKGYLVSGSSDCSIKIWDFTERLARHTLLGHSADVLTVAFSIDGNSLVSGSRDKSITIWDLNQNQAEMSLFGHSGPVKIAEFIENGTFVVSADSNGELRTWKLKNRFKPEAIYVSENPLKGAIFTERNSIIALGKNYKFQEFLSKNNQTQIEIPNQIRDLKSFAFTKNTNLLACGSVAGSLMIRDSTKNQIIQLENQESNILSASFSFDGNFFSIGTENDGVHFWKISDNKIEYQNDLSTKVSRDINRRPINSISFSPNLKYFALTYGQKIEVWDYLAKIKVQLFEEYQARRIFPVLAFSNNGEMLAAGSRVAGESRSGHIFIFKTTKNFENFSIDCSNGTFSVIFSNNGSFLYSGHENGEVIIWNLKLRCDNFRVFVGATRVLGLSLSNDGNFLASVCDEDRRIHIWSLDFERKDSNLTEIKNVYLAVENVYSQLQRLDSNIGNQIMFENIRLTLSKDLKFMAFIIADHNIFAVGDIKKKRLICRFDYNVCSSPVNDFVFMTDNRHIITASKEGIIQYWNVEIGNDIQGVLRSHHAHLNAVMCLACSPDSKSYVSGSEDKTLILWDFTTSEKKITFNIHSRAVISVDYSPNGKFIVSGSEDKSIKILNIEQRRLEYTLTSDSIPSKSVKYSPDGNFIASTSANEIKIWNLSEKINIFTKKIQNIQIKRIFFSRDSSSILILCNNNKILNYRITQKSKNTKFFENNPKESVAFSKDFNSAVSFSPDFLKFWEFEEIENNVIQNLQNRGLNNWNFRKISENQSNPVNEITSIDYSRNQEYVVLGYENGRVELIRERNWDARNVIDFNGNPNEGPVNVCKFSPDSRIVAAGFNNGAKVWNIPNNEWINDFQFRNIGVLSIEFSSEGKYLALGYQDGILEIWNIPERRMIGFFNSFFIDQPFLFSVDEKFICAPLSRIHYQIVLIDEASLYCEFTTDYEIDYIIYSNDSKYLIICTLWGFDVFDISQRIIIEAFTVLNYDYMNLTLEILTERIEFELPRPLKLNQMTKELLEYQNSNNFKIEINKSCIDTNSIKLYQKPAFDIKAVKNCLSTGRLNEIPFDYFFVNINKYSQTVLHMLALHGHELGLENLLQNRKHPLIPIDSFGKSPIFYSIKKNNIKCTQIFLKYLISINKTDKSLNLQLSRIQNEFPSIIQLSLKEVPLLLNKLILETPPKFISSKIDPLKPLLESPSSNPLYLAEPINQDEIQREANNRIPVIIKYSAISLSIQTFSLENIELLKSLKASKNLKIFETYLIQKIVDYNWNEVKWWVRLQHLIFILQVILFGFCCGYGRTNLWIYIPFMIVYFLTISFEMIQIYLFKMEYFKDNLNWVDISIVILVIYWSFASFFEFGSFLEELILAVLLGIRGITSLKVFDNTRLYNKLIYESFKGMIFFLLVFFYSTLFFSLIIFILQGNSFLIAFESIWEINFSGIYKEEYEKNELLIFLAVSIVTILNVVLMLNLLISILSDTYDSFMLNWQVIDLQEKVELALEFQSSFLVFKKNHNRRNLLFVVTSAVEDAEEVRNKDWQGKIKYLEQSQLRKINEVNQNVLGMKEEFQDKLERIEELMENMGRGFQRLNH